MSRASVLIVEADPYIAISLREALNLVDLEVVGMASTVAEALRLGPKLRPDIGIFDVRLAGRRDGVEGARILREQLGLPVVFLAANADQASRVQTSGLDPVACLSTPVRMRHLVKAVEKALTPA